MSAISVIEGNTKVYMRVSIHSIDEGTIQSVHRELQ